MTYVDEITVGSIVQVGASRSLDRGMTWIVTGLHPDGAGTVYATIRSGGSGRSQVYPVSKLRLFRVTESETA